MLKLLLCSAVVVPCIAAPFIGFAKNEIPTYDTPSFEEAYIEPEFNKLERCETAELDVFFYDNYVTFHSAEYIADSIKVAKSCGGAKFAVTPISPSSPGLIVGSSLEAQMEELSNVLAAHEIDIKILRAKTHTQFNELSANGRAATIKISFSDADNA